MRTELYTALYSDTTLPNDIYWIGKPTQTSTFPCIIYTFLDGVGAYAFSEYLISETISVQLDLYTDQNDKANLDVMVNRLNAVMKTIGYKNISSGGEFFIEDIQKINRPTRWEKINV